MKISNKSYQSLVFLLSLLLLSACTSPTVHLNHRYLNESDTSELTYSIQQNEDQIELNTLPFPDDVTETTILYSPFLRDPELIDNVRESLQQTGYEKITVRSLVASNHWYTKNTIGVFAVPTGTLPNIGKRAIDFAHLYKSENCESMIQLTLMQDGKFSLDAGKNEDVQGTWKVTSYPYLLLENQDPYIHFYFEIFRETGSDQVGKIEFLKLKPLSNSEQIASCILSFGLRHFG
ncbi:hypothetical protein [Thalassotalea litorea]|uniref:hypothetical protein n=1 Tax=Thalassotalea litorea TaxID=2020715 RepID=UPI003735E9A6